MEKSTDLIYTTEYNEANTAHLFLYQINRETNTVEFGFFRNPNKDKGFIEIKAEITQSYFSAPIALAAKLLEQLGDLISRENMTLLAQGKKAKIKHRIFNSNAPFYLRQEKDFYTYLEYLCDNQIQYDNLQGKKIYFMEFYKIPQNLNDLIQVESPENSIEIKFIEHTKLAHESQDLLGLDPRTYELIHYLLAKQENYKIIESLLSYKNIKKEQKTTHLMVSLVDQPDPNDNSFRRKITPALLYPLFYGLYHKNNTKWKFICPALKEELPRDEKILKHVKTIIFPGGRTSANDDFKYLREVEQWILFIYEKFKHIKILGICLGHQVICRAFGGTVNLRTGKDFLFSYEDINVYDNVFEKLGNLKGKYVKKSKNNLAMEVHEDEVVKINEDVFFNAGDSNSCNYEICMDKENRILTMQFHPEFCLDFIAQSKVFSVLEIQKDLNVEAYEKKISEIKSKVLIGHQDDNNGKLFREICYQFID